MSQMENGLDTDTNTDADFNFSGVFNKAKGLFSKGVSALKNRIYPTKKKPPTKPTATPPKQKKQKAAAKAQNARAK